MPLEQLTGNGKRILLVEDHEGVRRFASTALSKYGFIVLEASIVFEATELFKEKNGMFDLVFTDLILPDKSGLDLVHILKKIKSDMAYLLCSGYTDKQKELEKVLSDGYQFLHKPYTIYDLLYSVHTAVTSFK